MTDFRHNEAVAKSLPGAAWRMGAVQVCAVLVCAVLGGALAGCNGAAHPSSERPPRAEKWYQRAAAEFKALELEASYDSARHALDLVPADEEVRVLVARGALARLEYDEVVRLLQKIDSPAAYALRGRAYWYKGEVEQAAIELDKLLDDPDVNDPWAKAISGLAHRGAGRKPFEISTTEGRLETVEMVRVMGPPLDVIPIEIDGQKALALISTRHSEVVLDSATRKEPGWVSLRFGKRLEVRDVPALTEDLSDASMRLGVPIKALIGINLLRHLNATLDHRGRQLVVRAFAPPPPPVASRIALHYLAGDRPTLVGHVVQGEERRLPLLVDSAMDYTVALDREAWQKIGVDVSKLSPLQSRPSLRRGQLPLLKLGAFTFSDLPAVYGLPFERDEKELGVDLAGSIGAGLLAGFRLTFADGGRVLWVEQRPPVQYASRGPSAAPGSAPVPGSAPPVPGPAAKTPASAPGAKKAQDGASTVNPPSSGK